MYDIMNYIERKSDAKITNANTYLKWMKQHETYYTHQPNQRKVTKTSERRLLLMTLWSELRKQPNQRITNHARYNHVPRHWMQH